MKKLIIFCIMFMGLMATQVAALPITFTGSGSYTEDGEESFISASVTFDVDDVTGDLIVTLTNTSEFDVMRPSDVLTAVFFDIAGSSPADCQADASGGYGRLAVDDYYHLLPSAGSVLANLFAWH